MSPGNRLRFWGNMIPKTGRAAERNIRAHERGAISEGQRFHRWARQHQRREVPGNPIQVQYPINSDIKTIQNASSRLDKSQYLYQHITRPYRSACSRRFEAYGCGGLTVHQRSRCPQWPTFSSENSMCGEESMPVCAPSACLKGKTSTPSTAYIF